MASDSSSNDSKAEGQDKKIVKPHERQKSSYPADLFQQNIETDQQPPITIVVQGSKQSGKSTVIRSLVKHFTKQKINKIKGITFMQGPITMRINKHQRITLIEAPNDLASLLDLSKIADLVLFTIDASIGFELETFEFISVLKQSGFNFILIIMVIVIL